MNVGGVSASLAKAQAENHLSLASINIDFSLLRVEPPREYLAVGTHLSPHRKEEADVGQLHATASKLGLLFDDLVPEIPHLIKAYGLRCSEAAQSPLLNPRGGKEHGLFASQVGADGTTIWAAATSGNSAIAIHLLACMLARMWESPKAISIWMELIAVRKQELASSGNPLRISASRVELSRDQIAVWDASARSWCFTADQANERRQKQLRLIIDHLGLPISLKSELSPSVIEAWQTAMEMVDKLVSGQPQSAHSGAALLGLASWHLYPDLIVFGRGRTAKEVKQNDHLVHQGGMLTLGIEDTRGHGRGIYWSLSLAHLRFYGDPVLCETSLHLSNSRVSIEQFVFVAFGSFIGRWIDADREISAAARLCIQIYQNDGSAEQSWQSLLAWAARSFLDSADDDRRDILRLIKCGRRRFPWFIDHRNSTEILGLSDCKTFLGLLTGPAARVKLLREVAKDIVADKHFMVIHCKQKNRMQRQIFPVNALGPPLAPVHWTTGTGAQYQSSVYDLDIPDFGTRNELMWKNVPRNFYAFFLERALAASGGTRFGTVSVETKFVFGDPDLAALYSLKFSVWGVSVSPELTSPFEFGCKGAFAEPKGLSIRHIAEAISSGLTSHTTLSTYSWSANDQIREYYAGLRALRALYDLYKGLPGANLDLKAANTPLYRHKWLRGSHDPILGTLQLSEADTLACIARFESGNFDLEPSAMNGVFAISNGNSLYVARKLLQDPCRQNSSPSVARVVGTVGRSGMAMLLPPRSSRTRPTTDDYVMVNHDPFNGHVEDCFPQTSLHMSFTDWTLAIDVGSRGIRDVEAYYVETAVGLYDHGKWVADVAIADVHDRCRIMPRCHEQRHDQRHDQRHEMGRTSSSLGTLVAIDNWDELIDSPLEVAVVRAHGNWQARLAAAALSAQRGHETVILPEHGCWACCAELPARQPVEGHGDSEHRDDNSECSSQDTIFDPADQSSDEDLYHPAASRGDSLGSPDRMKRKRKRLEVGVHDEAIKSSNEIRNRVYIM